MSNAREFIIDVYVYAKTMDGFFVGTYDMLCDGGRVESRIIKYRKGNQELSCIYVSTLHKAFLRAADYIGKYAIPIIDPQKDVLVKRGKRLDGRSSVYVNFVFRFHIVDTRALAMVKCDNSISFTQNEEKWKNLFKLLTMNIQKTQTPYKNLIVRTRTDTVSCKTEEVADMAEYADTELKNIVNSHNAKNGQ